MRPSGRKLDEMRSIQIETNVTKHAEGSCLIKVGDTHVLCTATVEDRVPPFIKGSGLGWVTAEYGMLPRSTSSRMRREAASGKQGGRTVEIQRLIGRSLVRVLIAWRWVKCKSPSIVMLFRPMVEHDVRQSRVVGLR